MKKNKTVAPKAMDDPGKLIGQPRELRQYEVDAQSKLYNDTSLLVHQLAVFSGRDYVICKINAIDFTGQRFECSTDTKSKWLSFNDGILFNFMNEDEYKYYYDLYASKMDRPKSMEKILDWLKQSRMRMGKIDATQPNEDPFVKNSKRS